MAGLGEIIRKKEQTKEVLVIVKNLAHFSCFLESLQMNFSAPVFIQTEQGFIRPAGRPHHQVKFPVSSSEQLRSYLLQLQSETSKYWNLMTSILNLVQCYEIYLWQNHPKEYSKLFSFLKQICQILSSLWTWLSLEEFWNFLNNFGFFSHSEST